jgi:MFS family permease
VTLFELGNCATTLLILRATNLLHPGRSTSTAAAVAVLLYAGHNFVASLVAFPAGHGIDRRGARPIFALGLVAFALAYVGFAWHQHSWPLLLLFFVLAGAGVGLAETAESALVARLLPDELRGSGFGLLGGVQSLGDFVSSAAVGLIWTLGSPTAAFLVAAAGLLLSLVTTLLIRPAREPFPNAGTG